jgi:hypothetical protein
MSWDSTLSGYAASDGSTGDEAIYVNVGSGSLTITVLGGTTPSIRTAGATVTVNSDKEMTFSGLPSGTEARAYLTGTTTQVAGEESITDGDFVFTEAASTGLDIRFLHPDYKYFEIINFVVPSTNTEIPVSLVPDLNYSNP